jgi:hypothetical protein
VALAYIRAHLGELAEVRHALLVAPGLDERGHPFGVGGLDADAPAPLGIDEALVGGRDLGALHLVGVEADDEEIHAVGKPHAMRGDRLRRQVGDVRRVEFRQQLLARQHLHLRAVGLDHVDRMAPPLGLGDGALHDLLRDRAPQLDLHAVFLLERLGEGLRLGRRERGVKHQGALLLRLQHQALVAVRAAITEDLVVLRRRLRSGGQRERGEQGCDELGHGGGGEIDRLRHSMVNFPEAAIFGTSFYMQEQPV